MKNKQEKSTQEWLPFEYILENGIIKLKNSSYIKIIKIIPINFNLKSELEKEAILNSYKIFLKTCNFNFQILIQSNKENLDKHISNINTQKNKEKENNDEKNELDMLEESKYNVYGEEINEEDLLHDMEESDIEKENTDSLRILKETKRQMREEPKQDVDDALDDLMKTKKLELGDLDF